MGGYVCKIVFSSLFWVLFDFGFVCFLVGGLCWLLGLCDCIPGQKSGILRIQYGHAAAAAAEISFGHNNLKNILVSTFKFGMWVYMGNATNAIVW